MSDIRKITGAKGSTYQVRFRNKASASGYTYKSFKTRKEALAFSEDARQRDTESLRNADVGTVDDAVKKWLDICEKRD